MGPLSLFYLLEGKLNDLCRHLKVLTPKNWQYCCVASGCLCSLLFLLSLVAPDFLPPVHPSWDAKRVHEHYFKHEKGVQAGAALMLLSGGFYLPLGAVISKQMRRIPGIDPILCDLQLASCAAGIFTFIMPACFLGLITFRDYGPELTLLLSDLFWLSALLQWPTFLIQSWTTAWAVFADTSPNPVFPKSMAILNFVFPLVFSSMTGIHTQHGGPYAWNGGLTFWPVLGLFGAQFAVDSIFIFLNIRSMDQGETKFEVSDSPLPPPVSSPEPKDENGRAWYVRHGMGEEDH